MQVTLLDTVLFITYFLLLFLSIFWLLVLFSREDENKKKKLERYPTFSAIVPAFNEENSILATLQSLVGLEYPAEKMQIIVVNDGSTDNTQEVVEKFIAASKTHLIHLINQENQGKGKAMNKGLELATGEYFACLDADSFVHSNALREMLPLFADNVAAVCPLLKVKKPSNLLQKVQWCEYVINMFYKYLNAKINCIHVTPGPFSVYVTKIVKDLGGYDENTITEDLEIAIRLQKHQYTILQTFDAIVETNAPTTWKALFKQRVRWYKGSVDNSIRYKKMIFNKKYGDFGVVRMPTIILSGIVGIVLAGAMGQAFIRKGFQWFAYLKEINFDIMTLIRTYSPTFNLLNLPFFKLVVAGTLLALSLFVMVYSFRIVKEKISNYGRTWVSVFTYLLIYALFLTTVWFYISYLFIKKKKNRWS